jgi:Gram-negative bacterial TonB protein C-terminal/PilZ domain
MANDFADSEKSNSLGIAESRTHSRARVHSLAYIELSDGNGGLILNISEDGIAMQAVQMVSAEQLSNMRFRLPKTSIAIEATGRLVWQLRSKKEAGIQFVNLSDEAREGIRKWVNGESSRGIGAPEAAAQQTQPAEKPSKQSPAPQPAPVAPVPPVSQPAASQPAAAAAKPVPPAAKPKKPILPVAEPQIPSAPQFASSGSLPSAHESVLPVNEPQATSSRIPPSVPPSEGSAFPAGQIKLPKPPRPQGVPVPPPLGNVANMPSWNGYVAPGIGMRYRKPRRWWTYTAALGIIAAVGFAGLMMIDPSTISRARLATAAHEPDSMTNVPRANSGANAPSSSVSSPSNAPPPAPGSTDSGTTASRQQKQTPQIPTNDDLPAEEQHTYSAKQDSNPQKSAVAPANPRTSGNSASDSSSDGNSSAADEKANTKRRETGESATERAEKRTSNRAAEAAGSYQPGQSQKNEAAPPTSSPASAPPSNGTSASHETSSQPSAPAAAAPLSPPVTSATTSAVQPTAVQKDQDDYARTARQETSGTANSSKLPAQQPTGLSSARTPPASGSSVVVSGGASSPVPPSVPLVGVPSGSVGATSQFHAIRIPPELQSKAAQLAGNLQIGQMLSSYSPSYPVDAARAGVEGIVKLDVIVAANGNVETVKILSGPPALAAVSISAVKQWHYGETLLGGQPIEAEQYVTLVFRLAK